MIGNLRAMFSDKTGNALLNYSPKLKFIINFGDGNIGWQIP
jgi:hypothetical protein